MTNPVPLDISAANLRLVTEILQKYVPGREVWAFGSRVTGKARKYSDLDLAIIGNEPLPAAVKIDMAEELPNPTYPLRSMWSIGQPPAKISAPLSQVTNL